MPRNQSDTPHEGSGRASGRLADAIRRIIDVVIAGTALLLLSPVMLAIAVIIRLGTRGPAIFAQERIGRDRKPFRFLKFRTLYVDARERFPEMYAYQFSEDDLERMTFKPREDPRVTRQGAWLRKTSLDELPNLWNVLRGDMTLVGPRPEIPEMLRYYTGEMNEVFRVRPGLTGAAQVSGRGNLSIAEAIRTDVRYLRSRTAWSDCAVIARTFLVVLRRDGAF